MHICIYVWTKNPPSFQCAGWEDWCLTVNSVSSRALEVMPKSYNAPFKRKKS